jgi:hypothetical protein
VTDRLEIALASFTCGRVLTKRRKRICSSFYSRLYLLKALNNDVMQYFILRQSKPGNILYHGHPLKESTASFLVGGNNLPYTFKIHAIDIADQAVSALGTYITQAKIEIGQIRTCAQCGKTLLLQRKPRANRRYHCRTRCSRLSAICDYRARAKKKSRAK